MRAACFCCALCCVCCALCCVCCALCRACCVICRVCCALCRVCCALGCSLGCVCCALCCVCCALCCVSSASCFAYALQAAVSAVKAVGSAVKTVVSALQLAQCPAPRQEFNPFSVWVKAYANWHRASLQICKLARGQFAEARRSLLVLSYVTSGKEATVYIYFSPRILLFQDGTSTR